MPNGLNYQDITTPANEADDIRRLVVWPKRQTLPEAMAENKHTIAILYEDWDCSLEGPANFPLDTIQELFNAN
jgi:hypothetical protein